MQETTLYAERRRRVADMLEKHDIDALLVTHLVHVRYLSSFSGSNAALLIRANGSAVISTDGRYATQIKDETPDLPVVDGRDCAMALLDTIDTVTRVGVEAAHVSWDDATRLEGAVDKLDADVTIVPVRDVVEAIRLYKDPVEQDLLRDVAALASQAYEDMLDAGELRVGRSEREVAADLEYRMRMLGSERVSFETIVASGPNSAKPHHSPCDRIIEHGDIVTFDFGAHARGYNSDMTRTVIMGEADDFSREIYEVVLASQLAGVVAAVPGASLLGIDDACRRVIADAGYGEYFVHSTGHGVGLDVHEPPYASQRSVGELAEHQTLTIEPGIYVPGRGGVRIEDTLIISHDGPEIITTVDKMLRVV